MEEDRPDTADKLSRHGAHQASTVCCISREADGGRRGEMDGNMGERIVQMERWCLGAKVTERHGEGREGRNMKQKQNNLMGWGQVRKKEKSDSWRY